MNFGFGNFDFGFVELFLNSNSEFRHPKLKINPKSKFRHPKLFISQRFNGVKPGSFFGGIKSGY